MSAAILIDDLETYIGQYGTHGGVQRLQYIISKTDNTPLKIEAGKLLVDMLKRTTNAKGYTEAYATLKELMEGGSAAAPQFDSVWVEATQKQSNVLKELYEQDLHQAKSSQIKENIRTCHAQLTNLCIEQGDYAGALKHISRSREYCTDGQAVFATCMTIIKLSALLQQYPSIQSFASKAQHTPSKDEAAQSKIHAAYGLYGLTCEKYSDAAASFVQVRASDLGTAFSDVLCAQDLALYGALCGLATFKRSDLQTRLLEAPHFRETLDLVPSIRDIVSDFYHCRYASALAALEKLRAPLLLDMYLHGQAGEWLFTAIRRKAIERYFAPFVSVSLHSMAKEFNTDVDGMQKEVAELIRTRKTDLDAKIDSHRKILHARKSNQRRETYKKAMQVSQDFVDTSQALLLRMNLIKHDFFGVQLVRQKK